MLVIRFALTPMRRIAALAGGMAIWFWLVPVAAAQTAAPAPFPITPDSSECVVAPRSVDLMRDIFATPDGTQAGTNPSSQKDVIVPVGEPVDAVIAADVMATLRELFACYNAGDMRRVFALMTDAYLRDYAAQAVLLPEDVAYFLGEPRPAPANERFSLAAVTDLTMLDDGRVGAFVVSSHPLVGVDTEYMILALQDGRWYLDEVFVFV